LPVGDFETLATSRGEGLWQAGTANAFQSRGQLAEPNVGLALTATIDNLQSQAQLSQLTASTTKNATIEDIQSQSQLTSPTVVRESITAVAQAFQSQSQVTSPTVLKLDPRAFQSRVQIESSPVNTTKIATPNDFQSRAQIQPLASGVTAQADSFQSRPYIARPVMFQGDRFRRAFVRSTPKRSFLPVEGAFTGTN
jgi:hypothetical protein